MQRTDKTSQCHFWAAQPSHALSPGRLKNTTIVLPLGAIEQHGPHLPTGTDSAIADAMVAAVCARLDEAANVLFLPLCAISNSVEHTDAVGTLSLGRDLTFKLIMEMAHSVHRAGGRKLVIINAHGGNVGVMVDASHAIRAQFGMLCVVTNWMRLGLPNGIIAPAQKVIDIHGGQLETALMRAIAPELVDMDKAENFTSLQADLEARFDMLRAYGPVGFGWMGSDIHLSGAVGNASLASAADGQAIIDHQAAQMVRLLGEVAQFAPSWFAPDSD